MPYPSLLHPEPLALWQSTTDPYFHIGHAQKVLSQSLRGPWVLVHPRVCLSPLSISGGNGVWFCTRIAFSYHLAGACPLPLDMGYAAPVPTILLGFLWPWTWGISSRSEVTGVSPHEITMWLHSNWSEVTGQSLRQSLSKPEIPPNSLIIILTWSFFLPWGFPFASWMWTL